MQEMGRKLQGYLNMSPCKWFRFYCKKAHVKGRHLQESCSQSEDNTPMCCPDQLRLPRTCTLRRALASVHTHTHHTHTRMHARTHACTCGAPHPSPTTHPLQLLLSLAFYSQRLDPLPSLLPVPQGVCRAVASVCGWARPTPALLSALLPQEWAGLLKDCQVWRVSLATFYSFNCFSFFLKPSASFQLSRGSSLWE